MPSFPKWVKGDTKGHDHLIKFSLYYQSIRQVAKRYGINNLTLIYLLELYLDEIDEAREGQSKREIYRPEVQKYFNDNAEINEEGWLIIKSLIFTIRKNIEHARERRGRIIQ